MPAAPAPNAFKTVKRITLLIHQTYNTRMLNKQQPLQSISLPLSYILERAAQVAVVVVVLQNSPSRARAPFNSARGKLLHCGAKNREWGLSAEKREMHCVRYRRRRARIGNNMTDSRNSLWWQRADLDVCAYTYLCGPRRLEISVCFALWGFTRVMTRTFRRCKIRRRCVSRKFGRNFSTFLGDCFCRLGEVEANFEWQTLFFE